MKRKVKKAVSRFWKKCRRVWYRWRHGIDTGILGDRSMLPSCGEGKYVSVHRRGDYIDIIAHSSTSTHPSPGMIRMIPRQRSHGVEVEFWDVTGRLRSRRTMPFEAFYRFSQGDQEEA